MSEGSGAIMTGGRKGKGRRGKGGGGRGKFN